MSFANATLYLFTTASESALKTMALYIRLTITNKLAFTPPRLRQNALCNLLSRISVLPSYLPSATRVHSFDLNKYISWFSPKSYFRARPKHTVV